MRARVAQSTRLANEGTRFNNRTPKSWYAMTAKEKSDGVILNTTATDLLARAPIHVPRLASTGARAPSGDATDARRPTGAQRQCFGSARRTRIAVSRRRARATACVVCSVVATLMPCTVAVVTGFLPSGTYGPKRRIDGTPVSTRRAPNTCFLPQRQVLSAVGMRTDCNSGQRRRAARSFARRHRLWFVILAARLFVRSPVVLFRVHLPALCVAGEVNVATIASLIGSIGIDGKITFWCRSRQVRAPRPFSVCCARARRRSVTVVT